MDNIKRLFDKAKKRYDRGEAPLEDIFAVIKASLEKLSTYHLTPYGSCSGKSYSIFQVGTDKSRPILPALFLPSVDDFAAKWAQLLNSADGSSHSYTDSESNANRAIYTAVMSFAACYDLWKPKSRKTPGTFFEVVLGSLLSLVIPEGTRTKFIPLPQRKQANDSQSIEDANNQAESKASENGDDELEEDNSGSVSTDIVFTLPNGVGIVIPAKITTRERIVQPFAHQRILDSAMGEGKFISLLTCVSETQRDDKKRSVNEICVPGTIELFQEHLAKLGGIYYLDPPSRYLRLSTEGVIEVSSVGMLVTARLGQIVSTSQTSLPAA